MRTANGTAPPIVAESPPEPPPHAGETIASGARLALLLFLVYTLTTAGRVYSPDGAVMARVSQSLVATGSLAVPDRSYPPGFFARGGDGRLYGKYGLGLSLAATPLAAAGLVAQAAAPTLGELPVHDRELLWYDPATEGWLFFLLGLTNAAIVAMIGGVLYVTCRLAGFGFRTALLVAAAAGIASPLWPYSKTFFSEPLAGLALIVFVLALEAWSGAGSRRWAWLGGAALGVAILTKLAHVVLLPVAAAATLVAARSAQRTRSTRLRGRDVAAWCCGPLAALAATAVVNALRFGNPLFTGYEAEIQGWTTPLGEGLRGLLLSPGRGLVPFFPAALIIAASLPRAARRLPAATVMAVGSLAVLLAFYARWYGWDGGWCWGPRFLIPALPLLVLLLAPLFEQRPRSRLVRWLVVGTIVLSALIAASGLVIPVNAYHLAIQETVGVGYLQVARWSWLAYPPRLLLGFEWTYLIALEALTTPGAWRLAGAFGAIAGALVASAPGTIRRCLGHPPGLRRPRRHALVVTTGATAAAALSASGLL